MKIGVAVKENGKRLEHFGICEYFIIYNYDEKTYDIEYEKVLFSSKERRANTEEWEKSADAVRDCDIVMCERIGLVAKAELERMNIKVKESEGLVEEVLDRFIETEKRKKSVKL